MENSSEGSLSASVGDTEAESGDGPGVGTEAESGEGPDVGTEAEREMTRGIETPSASEEESEEEWLEQLTPRQIVAELDKYIVGQDEAKKSVAIALRNRWRRQRVEEELRDEILPNNRISRRSSTGRRSRSRRSRPWSPAPNWPIVISTRSSPPVMKAAPRAGRRADKRAKPAASTRPTIQA